MRPRPTAFAAVALAVALAAAPRAQSFSERLNPTGDPVGGFVGYSDIHTGGDRVVTASATPEDLLAAVEGARAGEVVYIEGDVDLLIPDSFRGRLPIDIPEGVTVASNRGAVVDGVASPGARIRSRAWADIDHGSLRAERSLFRSHNADTRITGLRIEGPADGRTFSTVLIYDAVGGMEVDNNDLSRGGAITVLAHVLGTHVHHNYIHHNDAPGYGYGVYCGNSGDATGPVSLDETCVVEANLFYEHRHAIDSGGGPWGDRVWRHNVVIEPTPNQALFKVHYGTGGHGHNTTVYRNLFWAGLGFNENDIDGESGEGPTGVFLAKENWTTRTAVDGTDGFFPQAADWRRAGSDVRLERNVLDYDFAGVPTVSVALASGDGVLPVGGAATFTASGADPAGHPITSYHWTFEDGTEAWTTSPTVTRTFGGVGEYRVGVRARNRYGVPSAEASAPVSVASDPALAGLAAVWEFDDPAAAPSGTAVDAHSSNDLETAWGTAIVEGKVGGALDFTSEHGRATLPNARAGAVQIGDGDLTVLFWINVRSLPDRKVAQVLQFGGSKSSIPGWEVILYPSGSLRMFVADGTGRSDTRFDAETGGWQLVEFSLDRAAGKLRSRVNTELVDERSTGVGRGRPILSNSEFQVGKRSTGSPDALLDQVRVYHRLLTDEERAAIYNGGAGRPFGAAEPGPPPAAASVPLRQGWNLVSLGVDPDDPDLRSVLADVLPHVARVEDGLGRRFEPDGDGDLREWDARQAYSVYALAPVTLTVEGEPIAPEEAPLALAEGWNWVPYFGGGPRPVADAFASVEDELVLVKDADGHVFAPSYGVDQIGELQPGSGYLVYVDRAATLTYPPDGAD